MTHNQTPQPIGLWTRNLVVAVAPTGQSTTLRKDKHPCTRWALNETEFSETYPCCEPHQFYWIILVSFQRRTRPPFPRIWYAQTPILTGLYMRTRPRMLRATSPALELNKNHPIRVDVLSYLKHDDEDIISLWSACWFKKEIGLYYRGMMFF